MALVLDRPVPKRATKADQDRWTAYAAAALVAIIRTDSAPVHAAQQAGRMADAMLDEHRARWAT